MFHSDLLTDQEPRRGDFPVAEVGRLESRHSEARFMARFNGCANAHRDLEPLGRAALLRHQISGRSGSSRPAGFIGSPLSTRDLQPAQLALFSKRFIGSGAYRASRMGGKEEDCCNPSLGVPICCKRRSPPLSAAACLESRLSRMQQERGHSCLRDGKKTRLCSPLETVFNWQNNSLKAGRHLKRGVFAKLGCCQLLAARAGRDASAPAVWIRFSLKAGAITRAPALTCG